MEHRNGITVRIEELVEHREWALRLARGLVGDQGEPEGLVQEALTAAWLRPPSDIRNVRAWLGSVLRRRAATELRAAGRREEHELRVARTREGEATYDVLLRAEMHRRLVDHILALQDPEARALLGRYFDGKSPEEIAHHEGCAVSTVHNRLTRARGMLRARLDQDGGHQHWMGALAAIPAKHLVGTSGLRGSVAATPWTLAIGSKLLAGAAVAVASVLALVFFSSPRHGPQGPPPAVFADGIPAALDLAEESVPSRQTAPAAAAARPGRVAIATLEQQPAADDGLFHGRLVERLGEALRPLAGTASLRIAAANEFQLQEPVGQRAEVVLTNFTGDGEGGFMPTPFAGEPLAALDGNWSMPIPEDDMVLLNVERSGQLYRPADSPVISTGAESMTVVVEPVEEGSLVVTDEAGVPITSGIAVRSGFDIPNGRTVNIEFTGDTRLSQPEPSGFEVHRAPKPGASTTEIAAGAASPVPIPAADYLRDLWIGKEGYQWQKLEWPAHAPSAEVTLRRVGGVEIEVSNRKEAGGAYDFLLSRERTLTVNWNHLTSDGIYRAEGLGAGTYELVVIRKTRSHTGVVHRRPVKITAGEAARVTVDLAGR